MKKNKLIIGSRGSELALWQSNFIKREIEKRNRQTEVEIKIIKTTGDKLTDIALSRIGDKGLFTKELEIALLNRDIDIAVHSLKDLQTDIPDGLKLSAVTKRHPVEDVLIARKKGITVLDLPEGAVIATGSLRRRSQLLHIRPDVKVIELRGNVPTRIKKFLDSDWNAIILARAGVERLNLKKYISSVIDKDLILPAVGQGALGIEIHSENKLAHEILQAIHDQDTFISVTAERAFLKVLEGGCQVPIGAYAEVRTTGLFLDGVIGSVDGTLTFRKSIRGSKKDPNKLGCTLAQELVSAGAGEILKEIYSSVRMKK